MTDRDAELERRLRVVHDEICPDATHDDGCFDPECPDRVALRAAARIGAEDALERAAKVAQHEFEARQGEFNSYHPGEAVYHAAVGGSNSAHYLLHAIRALKERP